mgnify:CR=1 FL=1
MKNLIPKRVMEYIIITFAVVLMDVGIYVFKFPNNFPLVVFRVWRLCFRILFR